MWFQGVGDGPSNIIYKSRYPQRMPTQIVGNRASTHSLSSFVGGGNGKVELHHMKLIMTFMCSKGCFRNVILAHTNLMVV